MAQKLGERPVTAQGRLLAWVGFWGAGAFILALVVLHLLSLPGEPTFLSQYVHGPVPWLWVIAAYSIAAAGCALAVAVAPCLSGARWGRIGVVFMGLAGLAGLAVATFPVDASHMAGTEASLPSQIHDDAAPATFGLSAAAMLVLVPDMRSRPPWRSFGVVSLVLGSTMAVAWLDFMITISHTTDGLALIQRAMAAGVATWLLLLAVHLLRLSRSAPWQGASWAPPGRSSRRTPLPTRVRRAPPGAPTDNR
ncbi:MAG: DUF998 domain-containing protein [Thermoplasmatota archaeon]